MPVRLCKRFIIAVEVSCQIWPALNLLMAARKQRELITGARSQGDRRVILPREIARCWSVMNNSNYRSDNNSGVETHHANQSAQPVLYPSFTHSLFPLKQHYDQTVLVFNEPISLPSVEYLCVSVMVGSLDLCHTRPDQTWLAVNWSNFLVLHPPPPGLTRVNKGKYLKK